jgi:acyl-CoA synthetase (AMP-forming)/AMP-acid ligase II
MTTASAAPTSQPTWGSEIEATRVGEITYRMYSDRPRRIESLLGNAERWGDRPHIVQGDRRLSFADLGTAVRATSARLAELGVRPGQRVMILGWNSPDWIVNFWSVLQAGAVPVFANAWWSPAEVADAIQLLGIQLTLADESGQAKLPPAAGLGPWRASAMPAPAAPRSAGEAEDEQQSAAVIFTSGSSGRPKAVELSHRALLAGLQQLLHVSRRLPQQVDESSGDVALHTGPLFHIGGIQTLLRAVVVGGTLVMPAGRFDPADVLRLVEEHKIARWSAVPTMVSRVLAHPDVATRDVSSLKSITVGGAPVEAELLNRIRTGLPGADARIPTGYGLTENGGQATAASGRDTAQRPGCSGKPLPCVEITFLEHLGLPDREILLRAPTQMTGYLGETADSPIDGDGWLHTGDLGHLDEDGYLWITGRSKDLIIRGGENIAPAAVERALKAMPGVEDAAVVGVPHPVLGEEVAAFVVTGDPGATGTSLSEALRGRLASFAMPTRWHIGSEPLPTNHAHKVDKVALKKIAVGDGREDVNG